MVFIHCMNQFVHICKCVYSIHFVYKGLIHKWKCILHVHGPRNKRSAITIGGCCYLKLKYHKIYNSTMKIADSGNHLINIFKVSFVIRAYHIYAINSEIGSQMKNKWLFVQEKCPEQNFTLCHSVYKLFKKKAIGLLDLFGNDLE